MAGIVPAVILTSAVVATSWLGHVRNHLHSPRDCTGWSTTSSGVRRGGWAPEPLVQLLQERAGHIVSSNVDSIGHAHDNQRAFGRKWQYRVRGIQSSSRGFLNLFDTRATFANDATYENGRHEQSQWVSFRLRVRGLGQRFVVERANDQAEGLLVLVKLV